MYSNLYCKIYLDSHLEIDKLFQLINKAVAGKYDPIRTIKTDWGEIDVRKNSEFDEGKSEDFLFWKYYLDIEPQGGIEQKTYINKIAELIKTLKSKNIPAIASCDFEQEL